MATKRLVRPKLKSLTMFVTSGDKFAFQVRVPPRAHFISQYRPLVEVPESFIESVGVVHSHSVSYFPEGHTLSLVSMRASSGQLSSFSFCVSDTRLKSDSIEDFIHKVTQASVDSLARSRYIKNTTIQDMFRSKKDELHNKERLKKMLVGRVEDGIKLLHINGRW